MFIKGKKDGIKINTVMQDTFLPPSYGERVHYKYFLVYFHIFVRVKIIKHDIENDYEKKN
jgi:hypothetical protein